jgi:hypothetical protein
MQEMKQLDRTLNSWMQWMRIQRAVTWGLRGLITGLGLSLLIGAIGLWQGKIIRFEFLMLLLSGTSAVTLLAGLVAYTWRIQPLDAARKFDTQFHLGERVSTALELAQGKVQTSTEFTQKQLNDALRAAAKVKPSRDYGLKIKKRELLYAAILMAGAVIFWFQGENLFLAAQGMRNVQEAVDAQETKIEDLIQKIEANPDLTEEQKKALTEPLNEALQDLKSDPSLEGSVSTLTSTSEKMQTMTDQQAAQTSNALQETGQKLAEQQGSPLESVGEKLANGDTVGAANDLKNLDLSKMNASQLDQLADQLEQMADSVQATDPQLADQLRQAAQAARNGDTQSAQQALDAASQSMAEAGQQQIMNEAAQQAGTELQQGAGQVLAAGGGMQQSDQGQGAQGSDQSDGQQNGAGSGSGTGEANGESGPGNESQSSQIPQNNGAGDGGESQYEQIYAPSLLGGEDGQDVTLPTLDENGNVIGQGPVTPGEDGQSLVPYSEAYSQYQSTNQEAIDNGEVPFQFMQVIRSYFDSIQP